jgi:hypothetical protein
VAVGYVGHKEFMLNDFPVADYDNPAWLRAFTGIQLIKAMYPFYDPIQIYLTNALSSLETAARDAKCIAERRHKKSNLDNSRETL